MIFYHKKKIFTIKFFKLTLEKLNLMYYSKKGKYMKDIGIQLKKYIKGFNLK